MVDDGRNRQGLNQDADTETVSDSLDASAEQAAGKAADDIQSDGTPLERSPRNPDCFKAEYLGATVWFVRDEEYLDRLPPGAIAYTLDEARILANRSPWTRRMAHEAKKADQAITNPLPSSQPTLGLP